MSLPDNFLSKIDKTDTCWIWTAAKDTSGNGVYRHRGKTVSARRFLFAHYYPDAPRQRYPKCGNKTCVNPDHATPKKPKVEQKAKADTQRVIRMPWRKHSNSFLSLPEVNQWAR